MRALPPTRWLVYPVALGLGIAAGVITNSGIVAGIVALVVAVVWIGVGDPR